MISAASAQIEAIGGDSMKITIIKNGKPKVVPDYAKVQGILLGAIATFVIFITIIGPECVFLPIFSLLNLGTLIWCYLFSHRNHGSNFEQEKPRDGADKKWRSAEDEEKSPEIRSDDIDDSDKS